MPPGARAARMPPSAPHTEIMPRSLLSLALFAVVAVTLAGLVTGAQWLTRTTPGWPALPLGNLASWSAMIAMAVLARLWALPGPWVLRANVLIALALAWLPLSRMLAGEWALNFEGGPRWATWRAYTAGLGLALVGGLLAILIARVTGGQAKRP